MSNGLEYAILLRAIPIFSELQTTTLLLLASYCTEVKLNPNEILFEEGDMGDAFYVIISGCVRIERDGRLLSVLCDGECVGELATIDWEPRSATVVANNPVTLFRLDRNDFMDVLSEHSDLMQKLTQVLVNRLRATIDP